MLEYLTILKEKKMLEDSLIVYIGSAPGNNIYTVSILIPEAKFLLYDPAHFDDRLYKSDKFTIKAGADGLWTIDRVGEVMKIKKDSGRKHIIFISDIRMNPADLPEMEDNELNLKSVIELNAISYMLKFKCPYYYTKLPSDDSYKGNFKTLDEYLEKLQYIDFSMYMKKIENYDEIDNKYERYKYNYLDGKIYYQIFGPQYSTETRLIGFSENNKYRIKNYDTREYDYKNFNFNCWRNFLVYSEFDDKELAKIIKMVYKKKYTKVWVPTYENVTEVYLMYAFLSTFKKFRKYNTEQKFNTLTRFIHKIYKKIKNIRERRIHCLLPDN
jgi:hypothetical protein